MSDKKERERRRRYSTSSSSSSSSSDSSSDAGKKVVADKDKSRYTSSGQNVNKIALDIGYKIQQEELSDSEESGGPPSPKAPLKSTDTSLLKYPINTIEKQDNSKSTESKLYRSRSSEKRKARSPSEDFRKERSQSKDFKLDRDSKSSTKPVCSKSDRREHSRSREKKRDRSDSRDRKKRRSRSRERSTRSPSRDKKKERSRSKDRKRDCSKSREKRRRRSRSKEKRRDKYFRDSRSPSHKVRKAHGHSKRDERSKERNRRRSRSRSRPRKRSRSRSKSFERSKRPYDKKFNKLSILEKLGIELKVPEGPLGESGVNASGISIPSYYNPAGVNPLKYAQQMQKRKLIWGSKSKEGETSTEKTEEVGNKTEIAGPESVWKGTTFSQDQDGKLTAKFKRLMGMKNAGEEDSATEKNSELIQKQEEMFSSMEKQYEVARVSTHTHRGLGLGFGVHLPR